MGVRSKIQLINGVGIFNAIFGRLKGKSCRQIQEEFNIDRWHAIPYQHKEYAIKIVKYLRKTVKDSEEIIEIGCGTGDIIRRLKGKKLYGYDVNEKVIACAKMLDKKHKVSFAVGSFDNIGERRIIDYCITIGFMHGADESFWKPFYRKISKDNNIKHFIVDVIKEENGEGTYHLDFAKILPSEYKLIHSISTLAGMKTILVFEKSSFE